MACEENELLEVLRKKVMNLSDAVDKQNDFILKYEKALRLAVDDTVLASDCCACCPFFYDCKKEDMSVSECKEKFMHRWKSMAGLI